MESVSSDKKMKKGKKIALIILCVFLGIAVVAASTYGILYNLGKSRFHKGDKNISIPSGNKDIQIDEDIVTYNGKKYSLNENIVTILCSGIDKSSINDNKGFGENGQADCIFVAAIDTKLKKTTVIPIPRETMTDVDIYSAGGEFSGTKKEQVCLSYAYGNTPDSSSKNVIRSVSRILYGINISSHVTVDLSGIGVITSKIGGVPLTAIEDINSGSVKIKKGEKVNLKGKSAIAYVQSRETDAQASTRRLLRQKQFLTALVSKAGNDIVSDFTKLADYYNAMKPYTSSDITLSQLTYLASNCLTMNLGNAIEYKTIDGEINMGEKWVEFTPSESSVLEIIFSTFYTEIK